MPLVQKHDTLTDLIRKGADRKQLLNNERQVQSEYYLGWRRDEDDGFGYGDPDWSGSGSGSGGRSRSGKGGAGSSGRYDGPAPDLSKDRKLQISAWFLWIVDLPYIKYTRLVAIIFVFFTLTIGVSSNPEDVPHLQEAKSAIEYIVNAYYILDGIAKMMSLHCYLVIARDLTQHVTPITTLRRSGFVDVAISILCLIFEANGHTEVLKWLQLMRCMFLSLFFLEQMPQIDVLMSGITAGLKSTLYTWVLMSLTFAVFAALGVVAFRDNDPYHFGRIDIAMWTYFEMATLDNWSDVMNLNYFGCDQFPDLYTIGNSSELIETKLGQFYLPVCHSPRARPLVSSLLFVSFTLVCGFVLVSMTVAFVTTGIDNKLKDLKEEEEEEMREDEKLLKEEEERQLRLRQSKKDAGETFRKAVGKLTHVLKFSHLPETKISKTPDAPVGALNRAMSIRRRMSESRRKMSMRGDPSMIEAGLEPRLDPVLVRILLMQVWSGNDAIMKQSAPFDNRRGSMFGKDDMASTSGVYQGKRHKSKFSRFMLTLGLKLKPIVTNKYYTIFVTVVILFAAIFELVSIEVDFDKSDLIVVSAVCQSIFTLDLLAKLAAAAPRYSQFFDNMWNMFDVVLVTLLWIPVLGSSAHGVLDVLNVLRIIRLLKMLSWIFELNIIMRSISASMRCLVYVVFLMVVFFYHFGVAGVYLFSKNDPFHYGNIGRALLTLFQISTYDNWGVIARMNIYGCEYVTAGAYECDLEDSLGWGWVAALYFIAFIIVGVMVLVALFVGVIIASMELLQLSIKEENKMMKKVGVVQKELGFSDQVMNTLMEIFEMVDTESNGTLTLTELKPVMEIVNMKPEQQFEIFHKVDVDSSGKLDFSEFCYFVHMVGDTYSEEAAVNLPAKAMKMLNVASNPGGKGGAGKGGAGSKLKSAAKKVLAVADTGSDEDGNGGAGKALDKKAFGGSSLHSITKAVLHKMGSGMSQRSSSNIDDHTHGSAESAVHAVGRGPPSSSAAAEEDSIFGPPSDDESSVRGSASSSAALGKSGLSFIKEKPSMDREDSASSKPNSRTQSMTIDNDLSTETELLAQSGDLVTRTPGGSSASYGTLRSPSSKGTPQHPSDSPAGSALKQGGVSVSNISPTLARGMSSGGGGIDRSFDTSGSASASGKETSALLAPSLQSSDRRGGYQVEDLEEVVDFVENFVKQDSGAWKSSSKKLK